MIPNFVKQTLNALTEVHICSTERDNLNKVRKKLRVLSLCLEDVEERGVEEFVRVL